MSSEIVRCPQCGQRNRVPAQAPGAPRCGHCQAWLPWLATADDDTFAETVERSPLPVVVDLWATWCAPCRMVSPALERVARDLAGQIKLVKVDVDASPQLSRRFAVRAVPTLMVVTGGEVVARQAGAASADHLRHWITDALGVAT